jgi:hypothetical protein
MLYSHWSKAESQNINLSSLEVDRALKAAFAPYGKQLKALAHVEARYDTISASLLIRMQHAARTTKKSFDLENG